MALTVTHELADMQRHLWVRAPIRVQVDGTTYAVDEWSLGGVVLVQSLSNALAASAAAGTGGQPKLPTGALGGPVALQLELPFQGFEIRFAARGEIESKSADGRRMVIAFRDLGQRERDLLSHFIEQLVRGNMVSVDETIHRLGTPLAAAEFARTVDVSSQYSKRGTFRRSLRATIMTAAYAAAGIGAVAYLGSLLYTNLFWLEAPTSTISAPVQSLVSLGDGVVTWGQFKPGDAVKSGDVVLKVADTILEREIEQAEIGIRERENKLAFLARRLENEKKRLGALAGLTTLKSAQTNAEIDSLNVKLQAAQRELRQLPAGAVGPLAQVRQRIVGLQQSIALKGLDRTARASLSKDNAGSLEIVGQTVVGEMDNLAAQIELAEADVAIAQQRHQAYLNQRDRLAIRAPFDGIVRDLTHADLSTLKKGEVAAVIERTDQRSVTAFLRQDQLLRVQLGADAVVHVPATRQTFKAKVSEINPVRATTSHSSSYGTGQNGPPRRDGSMAAIRLTLSAPVRAEQANIYRDGLPAVTMIGLSVARTPWAPLRTANTAIAPQTTVPGQTLAQAPVPNSDTRNWLSRTFGGWLRRPTPQLGG